MSQKIKRNAVQCRHCGVVLESVHVHDFRQHYCKAAGKISRSYDHDLGQYVPDYPYIMTDGGLEYIRRGGAAVDMIDLSEYSDEA